MLHTTYKNKENADNPVIFLFHDLETRQDKTLEGHETKNVHVPNLCVAQHVYTFVSGRKT